MADKLRDCRGGAQVRRTEAVPLIFPPDPADPPGQPFSRTRMWMRRWTPGAALALLTLVTLTACGDARLKKLSVGIAKDSVAVLMKTDSPHRTASYLTGGKFWEIQLYPRTEVALTD